MKVAGKSNSEREAAGDDDFNQRSRLPSGLLAGRMMM
jgi:hypothetical protein